MLTRTQQPISTFNLDEKTKANCDIIKSSWTFINLQKFSQDYFACRPVVNFSFHPVIHFSYARGWSHLSSSLVTHPHHLTAVSLGMILSLCCCCYAHSSTSPSPPSLHQLYHFTTLSRVISHQHHQCLGWDFSCCCCCSGLIPLDHLYHKAESKHQLLFLSGRIIFYNKQLSLLHKYCSYVGFPVKRGM